MPINTGITNGTGCGGPQETGGIDVARSTAKNDAKKSACCSVDNVDSFELIDETIYSVGKNTCIDITAHITCIDIKKKCDNKEAPKPYE
jgi:hypothetical protein